MYELEQALLPTKNLLDFADTIKLQNKLTEGFHDVKVNSLTENASTPRDADRLRSLQGN